MTDAVPDMTSSPQALEPQPSLAARVQGLLAFLGRDRAQLLERQFDLELQLGAAGLHTPEAIRSAFEGLDESQRAALLRESGDPATTQGDGPPARPIPARRFDRML